MRENGPKSSQLPFLTPCLPSRISPSCHPSISGISPGHGFPLCNSLCCFCVGQQGWSSQKGCLRDMERNVWPKDKSCMKPSGSLLGFAFPSAVRLPRPLSGYQSVYSAWHCFLSSHFQRETWGVHFPPPHSHGDSWSDRKWKDIAGGAPPASYTPVSGRIWQLSCQREVVATWWGNGKKGPLWTIPLLIEMYPTQAKPTLGWIWDATAAFSLWGASVWVKSLLGCSGYVRVCGAGVKLACYWMESKGSYGC